jgi:energy-coupling factor transporter ATP-binding protein EcfA2
MNVQIKDYQSLKDVSFEIKGLTVITGPNNTGKSACARAVAGLFSNPRGHAYVRQGEKNCEVTLSDGLSTLIWRKGKGVNQYEVNGKLIDKVGSGVPDEVKAYGVVSVDVDGREVWPQVARQFDNIFLLDLPPSVLSSALSDMDTIQTLENASSKARSDIKHDKTRIKIKNEDLSNEKMKLSSFGEVDEAERLCALVDKLQAEVDLLASKIDNFEKVSAKKEGLETKLKILEEGYLLQLPVVNTSLDENLETMCQLQKQRTRLLLTEMAIGVGLESLDLDLDLDVPSFEGFERVADKRNSLIKQLNALEGCLIDLPNVSLELEENIAVCEEYLAYSQKEKSLIDEVAHLERELHQIKDNLGDTCPLCDQGLEH